ncbi:MAG TPA: putative nucleotidyltransferase substrate binding domain-containing protein, partial [Candidatus Ozemobacteraceae bacterium]|nr:putative nucleotidyltransferase substrate binding domain-containing protein [Candidatus Ozemobacteraceae bacterium]
AWFLSLGGMVCEILNQCGFAYCKGEVMANNAKWVQSYSGWEKTFEGWVTALEPKDLLHSKIFFDVRAVVDETGLIPKLYQSLWAMLDRQPRFFGLLAHNIQQLQPPVGVFGDFVCDPKITDRQAFDIKLVMAIFVDFARIYALRQKIGETNTVDRLDALQRLGVLTNRSHAEMVQAYVMLMKMRIDVQVKALEQNRDPDNYLEPDSLTSLDQKILKEVFEKVKHLQLKLGHDFTGSVNRL